MHQFEPGVGRANLGRGSLIGDDGRVVSLAGAVRADADGGLGSEALFCELCLSGGQFSSADIDQDAALFIGRGRFGLGC